MKPGTLEPTETEIGDFEGFLRLLDVNRPPAWPPPLNDEQSQRYFLTEMRTDPGGIGWWNWYVVATNEPGRRLAGGMGFKGRPQPDGTAEAGYSILETEQRRGYCSEALHALLEWAFAHPEVTRVIAHTFPNLTPSVRVLEKAGFHLRGPGFEEPGSVLYELTRSAWPPESR